MYSNYSVMEQNSFDLGFKPLYKAILDPRYFDNHKLFDILYEKKYQDIVCDFCSQIQENLERLNRLYSDIDVLPLDVVRKSLSFIPELDEIILDCCIDSEYAKNLSKDWSGKTCRSVLNPDEFDNKKFWNLLKNHQAIDTSVLLFNLRTNYCENGVDYLCYFPVLETFIMLNHKNIFNLEDILMNCAYPTTDKEHIHNFFVRLKILSSFYNLPKRRNESPIHHNDILGRDSIQASSASFYLGFMASVLTAGFGIAAIAIAVSALGATQFTVLGLSVMTIGVASIATSGFFFKSAWDEYHRPDAYLIKP